MLSTDRIFTEAARRQQHRLADLMIETLSTIMDRAKDWSFVGHCPILSKDPDPHEGLII